MTSGKTILCVDDDPAFGELYKAVLEPKGYTVHWVMNPGEGFKSCLALRPDLIILDVMMPEQDGFFDGYDLLKRLRAGGPCEKTPVMMVSAIGGNEDVKHGMELGANCYLSKMELLPKTLLAEVEKCMAGK